MNLKTIQKNYDKLTAGERFALLVAAGDRGDVADRAALLSSAPRKRWEVPTTRGLGDAFEWLAAWHVNYMLGCAASFYYLAFMDDPEPSPDQIKAMELIPLRILTSCEAWRGVCNDYGVNPEKILEGLPFIEMIALTELTIKAGNGGLQELPELQIEIDGMKAAIELKRKDWE